MSEIKDSAPEYARLVTYQKNVKGVYVPRDEVDIYDRELILLGKTITPRVRPVGALESEVDEAKQKGQLDSYAYYIKGAGLFLSPASGKGRGVALTDSYPIQGNHIVDSSGNLLIGLVASSEEAIDRQLKTWAEVLPRKPLKP